MLKFILNLFLLFSIQVNSQQQSDPIVVNTGQKSTQSENLVPESELGCSFDQNSESVCPEVWSPVCGAENVTYWNCCFHFVYGNSSSYREGKCEGDAPIFLTDDAVPQSDVQVEMLPVQDSYSKTGQRKLLDTSDDNILPVVDFSVVDGLTHIKQDVENGQEEDDQSTSGFIVDFETVFGKNDLKILNQTLEYPFHAIGRFQNLGCTGFLIDDKLVLIAAHCVWNLETGQFYQELDFTPGQNGPLAANKNQTPFGVLVWETARVPAEFAYTKNADFDFALVILRDSFMEACANAGVANCGFMDYNTECLDRNVTLNIAGYREDVEESEFQKRMWVSPCDKIFVPCNSTTFGHTCDTTTGMAGAPLWVYRPPKDDKPAVHSVRGIYMGTDTQGEKLNKAITLNSKNMERIVDWVAESANM